MDSQPLSDEFKQRDAHSYDPVIDSFHELTERYTAPAAAALLRLAAPLDDRAVLDVGCGTGVLALAAAAADRPPRRTVGLDLSEAMLAKARGISNERALTSRLEFQAGDAEHLPFADGEFDAVVSLYALRHFPDPAAAIKEMVRVTRRGGTITVGVGSGVPLTSRRLLGVLRHRGRDLLDVLRGRGPVFAPRSLDTYLDTAWGVGADDGHAAWTHGVRRFDAPVASLLAQAGCQQIHTDWIGTDAAIDSARDYWTLQATLSSHARKRLGVADTRKTDELRARYLAHCDELLRRGCRLVYRSGALITRAVRA